MEDLYTLKEMAEHFGVTKQYMNKLKNEDANFPIPVGKIGRINLFTKEQLDGYGKVKNFSNPHSNRIARMQRLEEKANANKLDNN